MASLNYGEISSYSVSELCKFVLAYFECGYPADCDDCLLGSTHNCADAVLAVLDEIKSRVFTGDI